MRFYTDAIVLLMLVGCGEVTSYPVDSQQCQPYHETYSHSVTYCGDEQSVYIACNPRVRDQVDGCVDDLLLKSSEEEGCYSENVCMDLAEWEK